MGYFLYVSNIKKNDMTLKEKELNEKISKLQNDITANSQSQNNNNTKNNNEKENTDSNQVTNNITTSSLSGLYVGNAKVEPGITPDGDTEVYLYLYEDGGFIYNNMPGLASGVSGYYTYNGNDLILHEIIDMANDIGRTIINDTMTLKINEDSSITDSKLSVVLKNHHKDLKIKRVL